jgi:hypothetical protein
LHRRELAFKKSPQVRSGLEISSLITAMEEERADMVTWVLYNGSSKRSLSDFGHKVVDMEKRFNRTNEALEAMTTWPKVITRDRCYDFKNIFVKKLPGLTKIKLNYAISLS